MHVSTTRSHPRRSRSASALRLLGPVVFLIIPLTQCDSEPVLTASHAPVAPTYIPAFPGAEGYGATALNACDRTSAKAFLVTSLENSGAGTLRQALAQAQAGTPGALKVITFAVGGYIHLQSSLRFQGDCLYIAGQTAQGGGITVTGHGLEFAGDVRDVVVRYVRIRPGRGVSSDDGILVRQGQNLVFDHVSVSWSPQSLMRFSRTEIARSGPIRHVSIQRSLLAESLDTHPTALQIGGQPDHDSDGAPAGWREVERFSIHHNAFVSNSHRNPNARGMYVEIVSNLVHNWNLDAGQTGRGAIVDWVNNVSQAGPMTRSTYPPIAVHPGFLIDPVLYDPAIHVSGHLNLPRPAVPVADEALDNWIGEHRAVGWFRNEPDTLPTPQFRRDVRISELVGSPRFPVTATVAHAVAAAILSSVGADRGLDCAGRWVPRQDLVDVRLLVEVQERTGWWDRPGPSGEDQLGGFPVLESGTPCLDSNHDGLPDEWKATLGLAPRVDNVATRIGSGGYSYLEHYVNGTRP